MLTFLTVLYGLSAICPIAGLVLAWRAARKAVKHSADTIEALERIEAKYDNLRAELPSSAQWSGPEADRLNAERSEEESRAGRIRFTYGQMDRAPHYVTQMILSHLATRFPVEIVLIVIGLIAGAVASVTSLWL